MLTLLRPNSDELYRASQTDRFDGLWTPWGCMLPAASMISPSGDITVVYALQSGAKFSELQEKKKRYVEQRGVVVRTIVNEAESQGVAI